MKLSIVIPSRNDNEIHNTVQSIRDTAGDKPEVLVVDDSSTMPLAFTDHTVRCLHNTIACGVGPSRTIGALAATGEYLLFIDAHSRFTEGWYEHAIRRIEGRPTTLHCGTCLGLDTNHMDVNNPVARYSGATLNIFGPDKNNGGKTQVFEPVWGPKVADDAELPCVMGANYTIRRDYFLKLNPLAHLRLWACDETMLSLKVWLSGGDVRYVESVKIGHKFYLPGERQRFNIPPGVITYNKLFALHTLTKGMVTMRLCDLLKGTVPPAEWQAAQTLLRDNWHVVAVEQAFNANLFKHDFHWFCEKFRLQFPG